MYEPAPLQVWMQRKDARFSRPLAVAALRPWSYGQSMGKRTPRGLIDDLGALETELVGILERPDVKETEPGFRRVWLFRTAVEIAEGRHPGNVERNRDFLQRLARTFVEQIMKQKLRTGKMAPVLRGRHLTWAGTMSREVEDVAGVAWTYFHSLAEVRRGRPQNAEHSWNELLFVSMLTKPGRHTSPLLRRLAKECLGRVYANDHGGFDVDDLANEVVANWFQRRTGIPAYAPRNPRTRADAVKNARNYVFMAIVNEARKIRSSLRGAHQGVVSPRTLRRYKRELGGRLTLPEIREVQRQKADRRAHRDPEGLSLAAAAREAGMNRTTYTRMVSEQPHEDGGARTRS